MNDDATEKSRIRALLDRQIRVRQVNRVLHGHPAAVMWQERELDVPAILTRRQSASQHTPLHVYVASPYCLPTDPDRCGFCLFPSEEYRGGSQLADYLAHLKKEGALHAPYFENERPESIYFGGGTSNLYKAPQYAELMSIVRGVFPNLPDDAEITLEGIPQTYTLEKLRVMKDCGINRISVGVQQFEDRLIALSGRKQKREHVVRVLGWCHDLGFRTSVDLIFGWPRQTLSDMVRDLELAVSLGVSHLTHYELNVGGRTDFARNHRDTMPSIEETLDMYRASRDFLTSQGFRQVTTYDWQKPDGALHYEDASRVPLDTGAAHLGADVWGWGYSAISGFRGTPDDPGWIYMNSEKLPDLFGAVAAGKYPIGRGYRYTAEDLELTMLYQALLGMEIGRKRFTDLFRCDVYQKYRPLWDALEERGWLHVSADALRLVGDGAFFTPTIQGLLSQPRVQAIQRHLVANRKRMLPVAIPN